jgi:predicted small metal-binding protein
MKTMTCKQLGGACERAFHADSFDEIAAESKQHAMEMFQQADKPHLEAMNAMKTMMQSPADMQAWFEGKRKEFEALPEDQ